MALGMVVLCFNALNRDRYAVFHIAVLIVKMLGADIKALIEFLSLLTKQFRKCELCILQSRRVFSCLYPVGSRRMERRM